MTRFCKTCIHLVADKEKLHAKCMFWVEFAKTFPMPFGAIGSPHFREMIIFPRHVWDDLPRAKGLEGIDTSVTDGPWSEVMDCKQWVAK